MIPCDRDYVEMLCDDYCRSIEYYDGWDYEECLYDCIEEECEG